jgi:threonine dehydrogenase-like Zn-dependent dehydrogenase
LTLGHEISGTVVAGDEKWMGKEVIIPAVMPCRKCLLCKTGRGNRCLVQKMPGNSLGVYGGFSSHIPVPSVDLCEVRNRGSIPLEQLAVVADAVTTPYQAAKRADLQPGDNVIIIGVTGGVGVYMAQTAKALGAKAVIGIARNPEKLQRALKYGVDFVTIKSGPYKDIMSPTREMTEEERKILQSMINNSYEGFVKVISDGRGMPVEEVKKIADGRIYDGRQAKELNLIDGFGYLDDVIEKVRKDKKLGDAQVVKYTESMGFGSFFNMGAQKIMGKDAEMAGLMKLLSQPNSPRLMYLYAE